MAIVKKSQAALFEQINLDNPDLKTPLVPTQVTNDPPVEIAGTFTSLQLRAVAGQGYTDKTTLRFNRWDLNRWFGGQRIEVPVSAGSTIHAILDRINLVTGLQLETTDVLNDPIDVSRGWPVDMLLRAAPTSLGYYGQGQIRLVFRNPSLREILPKQELRGDMFYGYPVSAAGRIQGTLLTYGNDYTAACATLRQSKYNSGVVSLQPVDAAPLAAALKAIDGIPWVSQTGTRALAWCLTWSAVYYNGPVEGYKPTPALTDRPAALANDQFSHVLVLGTNRSITTNLSSGDRLFFHYNDILG